MHFRRRIVHGDTARLFLLLHLGIVCREIRRDPLPVEAVIARAEQYLRADIDRVLVGRRQCDWCVPVEAQLLVVIGLGLDVARLQRLAVHATGESTLILCIDVIRIGRVDEGKETVTTVQIFPAVVGDASRIGTVAGPDGIVL